MQELSEIFFVFLCSYFAAAVTVAPDAAFFKGLPIL